MPTHVPIVRPDLGEEEATAVARVVRSGWIMQGPEVAAFENEFAAAVSAPHAVAVSSGTTALELALRALGIGPGDDVVTVSHSFIATANAILTVGARPIFVDVELETFGINPRAVEAALTPATRALLCVHQLGFPCALDELLPLVARRGIPLIEDAACALGSEIHLGERWERIGKPHGTMACFSFHPRKVLTTGDGGMVTTGDPALATRVRSLRQHAMTMTAEARDKNPLAQESYLEPAWNARMTDLSAAVGRPQLRRLGASVADRRRLAAAFAEALHDHPVLRAPVERADTLNNWQSYPTLLRAETAATQDTLLRWFLDRGIACRRGVGNAHEEPAYADHRHWSGGPLPISEGLRRATVMLPIFQGMTTAEEKTVVDALTDLRGVSF